MRDGGVRFALKQYLFRLTKLNDDECDNHSGDDRDDQGREHPLDSPQWIRIDDDVWYILCVSFRRDHCTYPFVLRGTGRTY